MTSRFLAVAVFAMAAAPLHATLFYNANISCPTCVTVNLTWAGEEVPIGYAEVDDNLGTFLFSLNISTPATTGAINPNPQTISGLSLNTIFLISNGQAGVSSFGLTADSLTTEDLSVGPTGSTGAVLALRNSATGPIVDSTNFTASVPEPAPWVIMFGGLGLLFLWRRKPAPASRRES